MRVQVFQHVPFEGPGIIAELLEQKGHRVQITKPFAGEAFPQPNEADLLVVMGGPMGVKDTERYPWLEDELRWLSQHLKAGKATIGVCLGAQLMAAALGAEVKRNPVAEIGWFPIEGLPNSSDFNFPSELEVLHWHGDTFDLPEGAVHLAKSRWCTHQAFLWGERAIGLQFHLESSPTGLDQLIVNCRDELVPFTAVQREEEIREKAPSRFLEANRWMEQVIDHCIGDPN